MRFTLVILAVGFCLPAWGQDEDKMSDEAIVQAAEKLIGGAEASPAAQSAQSAGPTAPSAVTAAAKPESEIPVVLPSRVPATEAGSAFWRVVASLALVSAVGAGIYIFSRRWSRSRDQGGNKARIEVMHQLHLGPRKSVCLIRVSGEAVLIGVTDHNVSLIKPVTLIDDEMEHAAAKDFNNFLEDEFSVHDVRSALATRV